MRFGSATPQHFAPVRQAEAEAAFELGRAEHGVRRAPGGRRIFGTRDRRNRRPFDLTDDRPSELEPACLAVAAQVIEPGSVGQRRQTAADESCRRFGKRPAPVGDTPLIGYDAQLVALLRESPYRQKEVSTSRSVYPAGAQNDGRGAGCDDGLLAMQLAAPVDIERKCRRLLGVRRRSETVEYIIGRVMNEDGTEPFRFFGENPRRTGIDRF